VTFSKILAAFNAGPAGYGFLFSSRTSTGKFIVEVGKSQIRQKENDLNLASSKVS
jgi:hypothetical protein